MKRTASQIAKRRTGSTRSHQAQRLQARREFLRSSALATVGGAATLTLAGESISTHRMAGLQPPPGWKIWVDVEEVLGEINRNIYGHMIEHVGRAAYDGTWVGDDASIPHDSGLRKDAIEAFRRLRAPVVRWPGGCFADAYHWPDGVGPRVKRPKRRNLWWGQDEPNSFGTDEFIRFCRLAEAEPYLSINVGTGTVQEALNWLEYCNSDKDTEYTRLRAANGHPAPYGVRYWGIGNETWGCGGLFTPDDYAREYLRYALYLKHWMWPSKGISAVPIELIAVGHTGEKWNQIFLENVRNWLTLVDHLSIHHYYRDPSQPLETPPGGLPVSGDVQFSDKEYYVLVNRTSEMERHLQAAVDVISYYSAGRKKIGLIVDEWGTWHPQATFETGFYQQNTLRDAIIAGSTLNLFNRRCRDIVMANLAQAFNVLQAVGLTKGPAMVLTPTFYVMEMYRLHQGASLVRSRINTPSYEIDGGARKTVREAVNVSCSLARNRLLLTAVNEELTRDLEFQIELRGARPHSARGLRLWSQNVRDHNTFDHPARIKPTSFTPWLKGGEFRVQLPAHSVSAVEVELA
jgi:alpha-L-arabinofuranosidase